MARPESVESGLRAAANPTAPFARPALPPSRPPPSARPCPAPDSRRRLRRRCEAPPTPRRRAGACGPAHSASRPSLGSAGALSPGQRRKKKKASAASTHASGLRWSCGWWMLLKCCARRGRVMSVAPPGPKALSQLKVHLSCSTCLQCAKDGARPELHGGGKHTSPAGLTLPLQQGTQTLNGGWEQPETRG